MTSKMTKSRLGRSLVAASAVGLLLVGCSDDPAPTVSGTPGSASTTVPGATTDAPADLCPVEDLTDPADVARFASASGIAAAQDEAAEAIGKTWRHYVPVTLTNSLDTTCMVKAFVTIEGSGGAYQSQAGLVVLEPGATAEIQLFDVEAVVDFDSDAQEAKPVEELTVTVQRAATWPVYDYYDADFEFGEISGEGAAAVLPVTVTKKGIREGVPEAAGLSRKDGFYVEGVDASGAVVARFEMTAAEALEVGASETYEIPATIAGSYDTAARAYQALDATATVAEYRVVLYQPEVLDS